MEEKRGEAQKPAADYLFEVSWEVCNKVGGINTVIKSKIPQTKEVYKDSYCLIGPYFHDRVKGEFEEAVVPEEGRQVAEDLKRIGMVIHYGRWLTEGRPKTILIDFQPFLAKTAEIKGKLWELHKIDSLHSGFDFDEPVVWSWAAGIVIEKLSMMMPGRKIVTLVHEWLSGAALFYLKSSNANIGTVFVTHATVIGRCLATAGVDIYAHDKDGNCMLKTMDIDGEAYRRGVHSKHQLERAAAHTADVFCTVSEITGLEAECTLGKKPDILVPNGLNLDNFPTFEDASIKHRLFRDKIYHFMLYYFLPYHNMDFDNTLIYFVASRYEFQN
ncbi:glycogen synthase, partial [Candidatus Woesearchaeota archaeon]|nr:glycogen synthase [Candidatus Woesearchaeota archaeon]